MQHFLIGPNATAESTRTLKWKGISIVATVGKLCLRATAFSVALFLALPITAMPRQRRASRQDSRVYRYPDGLFSCSNPRSWMVSEHDLGPGVTFFEPFGEALISLRYFPRSGKYRGRRLIPPVYRSPKDYYRKRIFEEMSISAVDAAPIRDSRLIPGSWKGRQAFEFSFTHTEELNGPEVKVGPERMRDDVVLLPVAEGLFAVDYSAVVKFYRPDRVVFQSILHTLHLQELGEPAQVGAAPIPQFPSLTLMGLPMGAAGEVGEPGRITTSKAQAPKRTRQWHGQFSGEERPRHLVVSREGEWLGIQQLLRADTPAPAVDFSKQQAVVVFAGQVPTGGYFVTFGTPTRQGKSLVVPYCVRAPQGVATEVLSQPWGVAVVAAAGLNVKAEEFCAPAAATKQDMGAIAGRVTDQENSPVPLVRVTAEGGPHGGKFTTETRRNGDYRLNALEPGFYRVTFINVGFQVVVFRNVKVRPGKTVTLNVVLRVDPCPSGGCR